ncbi:hypothetical protein E4U52_003111 [Claviceps spartinae]|nr:hypothetical protein E4U52_003111 [Claviceps spartinae]
MKFLCLHGAFGNASAIPPAGFSDYFGRGTLYRFIPFDGIEALDDVLHKLDEFPQGETAEDTIRQLIQSDYGSQYTLDGVRNSIEYILDAVREDPEIEGILGFSEGATAAASAILEEKRLCHWIEKVSSQCGIFFAGWPPLSLKGGQCNVSLADESEAAIDIPTCHVVGSDDPYIDGAMSLYSMCDQDSAVLFDHGSGHFVPREPKTLEELSDTIAAMMEQAEASFSSNNSDSESISDHRNSIGNLSMLSDDSSSASLVESCDSEEEKC